MNYKIILSVIAVSEEADAYLYYENQSEGLGEQLLEEIHKTLQKISLHPTHYGYVDKTNTIRVTSLNKFPFQILFQVFESEIVVYNIHHTKKNLK
jgi:hypothetical protein